MDAAYVVILRYEIPAGSMRVWVIEESGQITASGALTRCCHPTSASTPPMAHSRTRRIIAENLQYFPPGSPGA